MGEIIYGEKVNKQEDYNVAFSKNRSSFNPNLEKNFIEFSNVISDKNIIFFNSDFKKNKVRLPYLDKDYNNCNYQDIARKNNKTVEVFICNY